VRELFAQARRHFGEGRIPSAIETYRRCLELETDHERLGALNIQIGNCHHELREYVRAAEFYEAAAREAQRAGDEEGKASAIASVANTLMLRPASSARRSRNLREAVEGYERALTVFRRGEYPIQHAMTQNNLGAAYADLPAATPEEQAENVRKAIECYNAALKIYKKDQYPIQHAGTQNNLGGAYAALPAATPEERAENVRKAIECYSAALKIYKKDQYPHQFCKTAANLGMQLASIDHADACHWLKEAYSLREYLPDQGKRLEKLIREVCKD